ncbi:hypothetical protein BU17DRAFT_71839 [Hysterangium stoloniferum]|nr:hypothetical protein BU17DRAFT_71839 [Hysterangium stoloniferum]
MPERPNQRIPSQAVPFSSGTTACPKIHGNHSHATLFPAQSRRNLPYPTVCRPAPPHPDERALSLRPLLKGKLTASPTGAGPGDHPRAPVRLLNTSIQDGQARRIGQQRLARRGAVRVPLVDPRLDLAARMKAPRHGGRLCRGARRTHMRSSTMATSVPTQTIVITAAATASTVATTTENMLEMGRGLRVRFWYVKIVVVVVEFRLWLWLKIVPVAVVLADIVVATGATDVVVVVVVIAIADYDWQSTNGGIRS